MTIRDYVIQQVTERLRDRRMVVWYDAEGDFSDIFEHFPLNPLTRADTRTSLLAARRLSDDAWQAMLDPLAMEQTAPPLLIYVSYQRGTETETEKRCLDPFEAFALTGAAFEAIREVLQPSSPHQHHYRNESAPTAGFRALAQRRLCRPGRAPTPTRETHAAHPRQERAPPPR